MLYVQYWLVQHALVLMTEPQLKVACYKNLSSTPICQCIRLGFKCNSGNATIFHNVLTPSQHACLLNSCSMPNSACLFITVSQLIKSRPTSIALNFAKTVLGQCHNLLDLRRSHKCVHQLLRNHTHGFIFLHIFSITCFYIFYSIFLLLYASIILLKINCDYNMFFLSFQYNIFMLTITTQPRSAVLCLVSIAAHAYVHTLQICFCEV